MCCFAITLIKTKKRVIIKACATRCRVHPGHWQLPTIPHAITKIHILATRFLHPTLKKEHFLEAFKSSKKSNTYIPKRETRIKRQNLHLTKIYPWTNWENKNETTGAWTLLWPWTDFTRLMKCFEIDNMTTNSEESAIVKIGPHDMISWWQCGLAQPLLQLLDSPFTLTPSLESSLNLKKARACFNLS